MRLSRAFHELGLSDGDQEDIGFETLFTEIGRARVTHGHGRVMPHEERGSGRADDLRSPQHNHLLPLHELFIA